MSNYDVTIDDVILWSWFQFTNIKMVLPVCEGTHRDKLNATNLLSIPQKLAEILFFKVWHAFGKKRGDPPCKIFPNYSCFLAQPFSVMLQIGFSSWQEQIKQKRTEWKIFLSLILQQNCFCDVMKYFHRSYCRSKAQNENSKIIRFWETLNIIFQQNISFLWKKKKLKKKLSRGLIFEEKYGWLGFRGVSSFFLITVITQAPFVVARNGFRYWTPLVKFFQTAHLFAWNKKLDIKEICDVIIWDFVSVIMSKRLGQQTKRICKVWRRNVQKTKN